MTLGEMESILKEAESRGMSKKELVQQQISFAYGNANIENQAVTREIVSEAVKLFNEQGSQFAVRGLKNVPPPRLPWERID